jgi:Uncharacterized protein involved in methicillin resistance
MFDNSTHMALQELNSSSALASMRYTFRPVRSSQRELWDSFVEHHAGGHLLQSWAWGELKALAGWSPLRLALWDGTEIVAGAQVLCKTAPHVPLWLGHLAYIPRGPVLDWSQPAVCTFFLSELHRYLRGHGALALRCEPDVEEGTAQGELVRQCFSASGIGSIRHVHAVQPLRTILLDLAPSETELLAQMKEKWRYNVRLGSRKGVTVRDATSLADVSTWYALLQTTGERDSFGIHTLAYYQEVWQLYAPSGAVRLLLAEHEGQLLAGIFVGLIAGQAIYLYGASSNEQRKLMPNYVLQWEAIRWARERGARSYDFWGIPDTDAEDEAMAGVYRFKRGWGGRVVQYLGCYEFSYHPFLMNIARRFL